MNIRIPVPRIFGLFYRRTPPPITKNMGVTELPITVIKPNNRPIVEPKIVIPEPDGHRYNGTFRNPKPPVETQASNGTATSPKPTVKNQSANGTTSSRKETVDPFQLAKELYKLQLYFLTGLTSSKYEMRIGEWDSVRGHEKGSILTIKPHRHNKLLIDYLNKRCHVDLRTGITPKIGKKSYLNVPIKIIVEPYTATGKTNEKAPLKNKEIIIEPNNNFVTALTRFKALVNSCASQQGLLRPRPIITLENMVLNLNVKGVPASQVPQLINLIERISERQESKLIRKKEGGYEYVFKVNDNLYLPVVIKSNEGTYHEHPKNFDYRRGTDGERDCASNGADCRV